MWTCEMKEVNNGKWRWSSTFRALPRSDPRFKLHAEWTSGRSKLADLGNMPTADTHQHLAYTKPSKGERETITIKDQQNIPLHSHIANTKNSIVHVIINGSGGHATAGICWEHFQDDNITMLAYRVSHCELQSANTNLHNTLSLWT